jgi:hypothetical protein
VSGVVVIMAQLRKRRVGWYGAIEAGRLAEQKWKTLLQYRAQIPIFRPVIAYESMRSERADSMSNVGTLMNIS